MEFKDYYQILGVEPDADSKTIKAAYRKLARKYHPDVSDQPGAEDKFKEASEAYEVLGNEKRRAEYDELRRYGGRSGQFEPPPGWQSSAAFREGEDGFYTGDFSDFFSSMFGGAGRGGRQWDFEGRGQDVELEMPVFLEEVVSGDAKPIEYSIPHFDSKGRRTVTRKSLNIKIPPGVSDGERIRLKGQGGPGAGGKPSGDLYLRVRFAPHPLFDVEGHNLTITVPVAPWEAALGGKINVPTLTGSILLTIPENSQAGQRFRIKGHGLPTKTGRGDLIAVLKVVMPKRHAETARKHWQQLAELEDFDPRAKWRERA